MCGAREARASAHGRVPVTTLCSGLSSRRHGGMAASPGPGDDGMMSFHGLLAMASSFCGFPTLLDSGQLHQLVRASAKLPSPRLATRPPL